MNDLPPITVNQIKTDSDNITANPSPLVPNETGGQNAAAAVNPGSNNQLDKLSENLDEPNLADPLPKTDPPAQNTAQNLGVATMPLSGSTMDSNSSPDPKMSLPTIDPSMMGMNQTSSIGRRASLIVALLLTVIFALVGLGLMIMNQNAVLREQNSTLEEIRKLQRSSLSTATPSPTPPATAQPTATPEPTATTSSTVESNI